MLSRIARSAAFAFAFAATFTIAAAPSAASGQAKGEFAVFNAHEPHSGVRVSYRDWNRFLRAAVYDVGPSHRYRSLAVQSERTGTRLNSRRSRSPSWIEGNRVRFHNLDDGTLEFLDDYIDGMSRLAEEVDIGTWNRDVQLTFWLNLHNMLVMRVAIEKYPFLSAKRLHRKYWGRDLVAIKGVNLSIRDIEDKIVLAIWDDPMVIYGMFQAAVGGPGMRPNAFRSDTVWVSLGIAGDEFVNSNRGVNSWGKKVRASKFYDWTRKAFPNFQEDLKRHLTAMANKETAEILSNSGDLKVSYFDWAPADFYAGMRADGMDSNASSSSAITAVAGATTQWGGGADVTSNLSLFSKQVPNHSIPTHARQFMNTLHLKFRKFDMPQQNSDYAGMLRPEFSGIVTITELPMIEEAGDEAGTESR